MLANIVGRRRKKTMERKKRGGKGGRLVGHRTLGVGLDLFILLKLGKRIFILKKGKKNKNFKKQYISKQIS